MFYFMNVVRSFVNYAIFHELYGRMRFEVDCVISHHCIIPEGLLVVFQRYVDTTVVSCNVLDL